MNYVYENIDEYNPGNKIWIVDRIWWYHCGYFS